MANRRNNNRTTRGAALRSGAFDTTDGLSGALTRSLFGRLFFVLFDRERREDGGGRSRRSPAASWGTVQQVSQSQTLGTWSRWTSDHDF